MYVSGDTCVENGAGCTYQNHILVESTVVMHTRHTLSGVEHGLRTHPASILKEPFRVRMYAQIIHILDDTSPSWRGLRYVDTSCPVRIKLRDSAGLMTDCAKLHQSVGCSLNECTAK